MKIRYFADTDTLYVELNDRPVTETREINENTLVDLDDEMSRSVVRVLDIGGLI